MSSQRKYSIFVSYAEADLKLVEDFEKHLHLLSKSGHVEIWHRGKLTPGASIDPSIAEMLDKADIILLMISVDFLRTYDCYQVQLRRAMDRHNRHEACVIPIRLRQTPPFETAPFAPLQALPRSGKPIKSYPDKDEVWSEITGDISNEIQRLRSSFLPPRAGPASTRDGELEQLQPGAMAKLEVRFRRGGNGWEYELAPEGEALRGPRSFKVPVRPRELLTAILNVDDDQDLLRRSWHLRFRPKELSPESELPELNWGALYHPEDGCHLLDKGWTVTELNAWPSVGECSGVVGVIGNLALVGTLKKLLGPRVLAIPDGPSSLPACAVIVAGAVTNAAHARELQERALGARCPLLLWSEPFIPPRSALVQIGSSAATKEPFHSFGVRFLSRLLVGLDPELAFAKAGMFGDPEDRPRRWLRGAFASWSVERNSLGGALDQRWFVRLDRSKQEHDLNQQVDSLVLPNGPRRVQVIISSGPEGSGLDLFCHRPPRIGPELPRIPIVDMDLIWVDDPANQEQRLFQLFRSANRFYLMERLLNEATRAYTQQVGTKGSRVLFWFRHEVASLETATGLRQVTIQDLRCYCTALERLSQLARHDFRILIHIPIQGATDSELETLRRSTPSFSVMVLDTLSACIPIPELRRWLIDTAGLSYTTEEFEHMLTLPYDALVQWLVERFPELGFE